MIVSCAFDLRDSIYGSKLFHNILNCLVCERLLGPVGCNNIYINTFQSWSNFACNTISLEFTATLVPTGQSRINLYSFGDLRAVMPGLNARYNHNALILTIKQSIQHLPNQNHNCSSYNARSCNDQPMPIPRRI